MIKKRNQSYGIHVIHARIGIMDANAMYRGSSTVSIYGYGGRNMIDERDKIIEELRAQIESMKYCGNCGYSDGEFCESPHYCETPHQEWIPKHG